MLKVILLSIGLIALAIAAIAIKMFVKKDGEFKKSCSSVDPSTGNPLGCTCGQADGGANCENKAIN
ncbi:MAG: membrane or secreted protein [Bacteroidales bacterium]|nr:membrane or secreted protein [Bacteroidales bacterium]